MIKADCEAAAPALYLSQWWCWCWHLSTVLYARRVQSNKSTISAPPTHHLNTRTLMPTLADPTNHNDNGDILLNNVGSTHHQLIIDVNYNLCYFLCPRQASEDIILNVSSKQVMASLPCACLVCVWDWVIAAAGGLDRQSTCQDCKYIYHHCFSSHLHLYSQWRTKTFAQSTLSSLHSCLAELVQVWIWKF